MSTIRTSGNSARLGNHMSRYSLVDARLDNPHRTRREMPAIVAEAREYRERPRPLRLSLYR